MGLNGMILHKDHLAEEPGIAWKRKKEQLTERYPALCNDPLLLYKNEKKERKKKKKKPKSRFVQIKINALRFHFVVFFQIS